MRIQCFKVKFGCINQECEAHREKTLIEEFVWTDRESNPKCKFCDTEMEERIEDIHQAPALLKFNSLSPQEKRKLLKGRSQEHFRTKMKEEWLHRVTKDY